MVKLKRRIKQKILRNHRKKLIIVFGVNLKQITINHDRGLSVNGASPPRALGPIDRLGETVSDINSGLTLCLSPVCCSWLRLSDISHLHLCQHQLQGRRTGSQCKDFFPPPCSWTCAPRQECCSSPWETLSLLACLSLSSTTHGSMSQR